MLPCIWILSWLLYQWTLDRALHHLPHMQRFLTLRRNATTAPTSTTATTTVGAAVPGRARFLPHVPTAGAHDVALMCVSTASQETTPRPHLTLATQLSWSVRPRHLRSNSPCRLRPMNPRCQRLLSHLLGARSDTRPRLLVTSPHCQRRSCAASTGT